MRILIAEDELVSRKMLAAALRDQGHEVVEAVNGRVAWEALQTHDVRLVIADWEMPEMTGLDLVRKIRAETGDHYIYVILLTSRGLKQDIVRGLEAGADDYVTKPFDRDELMVRIKAGERVTSLEAQLAAANAELRRMALVDGLTGVPNRRAFDEDLARVREQTRRFRRRFSILMLDIDRFKVFNDTLGHEAGDGALRQVARILAAELRQTDKVYRYGGEEFVCLLDESDPNGARAVSERLRGRVQAAGISHPGNPPFGVVTISVGYACYEGQDPEEAQELVGRADQALYAAKAGGRNRVFGWSADCPAHA